MKNKLLLFLCILCASNYAQIPTCDIDIIWMIESGDAQSFRHELEVGLDPNSGIDDQTLLMVAAQLGNLEIVRDLIAHERIDIHAQDEKGNCALHYAALYGHASVIKTLLIADTPRNCGCGRVTHNCLTYQLTNNQGKIPADLAPYADLKEMLSNPDEYCAKHAAEFHETIRWFELTCPAKAHVRAQRLETFGQKVNRNYQSAKKSVTSACARASSVLSTAYQKTKDVTVKSYSASQKAREKVEGKYAKAKTYMMQRYDRAKDYAHAGYQRTKEVAASSYEKTKDAIRSAYRKVRGSN